MGASSRGRGMLETLAAAAAAVAAIAGCAATGPRPAPRADAAGACSDRTPAPCEAECYKGNGAACAIVGEALNGMADAPVRLPQDVPRGRKALDKGCQLGNLDACRSLVDIDSESTPPGTACAGWEGICKRGNRRSCSFFAQCLDHDDHFRQDRVEALRLFREGCDAGERVACRELGFHVFEGDGVPKDLTGGLALLARACAMDDQAACAHEGLRLEIGEGAPRDLERAKARYRTACARGIRPIPCEGLRRLGEEPPSTVVSSADARESIHVSARFGWEWRLPANWQFEPASAIALTDAPAGTEVIAARPRDEAARESLSFVVGDCAADKSLPYDTRRAVALIAAERDATAWFARHGMTPSASKSERFWGNDAVRIEARTAPPDSRVLTVTLFCKFDKRFEMRCLSPQSDPYVPCRDALGALMFHEPKIDPRDFPHVLHLRDELRGITFDAPDDSWLATGPHPGSEEIHWRWIQQERMIELTVGYLGTARDEVFDLMTGLWAAVPRSSAANVTRQPSTLSGRPCTHVVVDQKSADPEDIFIQRRGGYVYLVRVTAPKRDQALIEQARAGLRVDETPR